MIAPHAGNFIDQWLGDMAVGMHHGKREIGDNKTLGERAKSDENQSKLRTRTHICNPHEIGGSRSCAGQPSAHLHQANAKGAHQREMAKLGNHLTSAPVLLTVASG